MVISWRLNADFMGFQVDFMGFHGDLMESDDDSMGFDAVNLWLNGLYCFFCCVFMGSNGNVWDVMGIQPPPSPSKFIQSL